MLMFLNKNETRIGGNTLFVDNKDGNAVS